MIETPQHFQTKSAAETEALAQQLIKPILNKKIVLLSGTLGSGKTTFVKGIAKVLGIDQVIKSPTYTYCNSYKVPGTTPRLRSEKKSSPSAPLPSTTLPSTTLRVKGRPLTLHHYDLYRLPEEPAHPEQTAAEIGLDDALADPDSIVIIEWPERLKISTGMALYFEKKEDMHVIVVSSG